MLFTIDPAVYQSAVEEDQAKLESARLEVEKLKAAYAQAQSEAATARDALATAETQDDRQQSLLKSGVVPQATADDSALKLQQARGALAQAESRVLSAKAALAGDPEIATDRHPAVLEALAALHAAELDLAHTTIRAPKDGVVSQTDRLQQGQYVDPGGGGAGAGRDRQQLDRGELQGDRPDPHDRRASRWTWCSTPIRTSR